MRVKEFAKAKGVHTSTVYRWIREGRVTATLNGRPYTTGCRLGPLDIEVATDSTSPERNNPPAVGAATP